MATVQQITEFETSISWIRIQKWVARSRSWIALLILAPFLVTSLLSAPWAFKGSWGACIFDEIGLLLFFLGAGMRWWSTLYIGGRKTSALVTDGPYSICRNPLYFGSFCMGLAVAAFLESLTFSIGLLLATCIYLGATVSVEERRLLDRFGDEFTQYCTKVPRFFPAFHCFKTPSMIEVNTNGLAAESLRAVRWIWLPILCVLVAQLRAQPFWPCMLRLP